MGEGGRGNYAKRILVSRAGVRDPLPGKVVIAFFKELE